MIDQVANRLDLRPAAELLGSWPGSKFIQPVCLSINAVPALKGLRSHELLKKKACGMFEF